MIQRGGVINLLWMLVGIWMGVLLAQAMPDDRQPPTCATLATSRTAGIA